jgi:two-component system, response regulator YesN
MGHDGRFAFVVAEDEERIRRYLVRKIEEIDPSFRCVGTAADGEEAVELTESRLPDLLVTDIRMPVLDGLNLVSRIRRTNPDLRILIVSGFSEFDYAREAIKLGVDDYILKPVDLDKLRDVLLAVRVRLEASSGEVDSAFGLDRIGAPETELANAVETYLRETYTQSYSLEGLAERFGCKPAYLSRLYRKIKGTTPVQDILHLRVEKAKRLLAGHPDIEIKQVSAAVGYEDAFYFSRMFKKATGISPTEFKESRSRP